MDRYEVLEHVGSGAMADVRRCWDAATGKEVPLRQPLQRVHSSPLVGSSASRRMRA